MSVDERLMQVVRGGESETVAEGWEAPAAGHPDESGCVTEESTDDVPERGSTDVVELTPDQLAEAIGNTAEELQQGVDQREEVFGRLAEFVPKVADAMAARAMYRSRDGMSMSTMRAVVEEGRDSGVPGSQRMIGGWLCASAEATAPVTKTSQRFTVSHWQWLAAKGFVRRVPGALGVMLPYLFTTEAQIIHDLKAWSALDDDEGTITDEAAEMFAAVSGSANITLYGTVLLRSMRHETPTLPKSLADLNLQSAVRDTPRVTFAVGVTAREVVTAMVNNHAVDFQRRLRRSTEANDAAVAVRELLDPPGAWPAFPMRTPVTIGASVAHQVATDPDTRAVLDTEPDADAPDEVRVADTDKRQVARKGVRRIAKAANVSSASAEVLAEIASATTHATVEICLRTSDVDVSRGERASLCLTFLRGRGVVANYPTGNGQWRRMTFVPGDVSGIETGIEALRALYRGSP